MTRPKRRPASDATMDTAASSPYLAAAVEIGGRLATDAIRTPSGLTSEGYELEGEDEATLRVVRRPLGADVYAGAAGIAWFLGHLAPWSDDRSFAQTAIAATKFALAEASARLHPTTVSLYSGATGVALSAYEVGQRLRRADLCRAALSLARRAANVVSRQAEMLEVDLIGGRAGIVVALLAINRHAGDAMLVDASRIACDRLVGERQEAWWGSSWPDRHAAAGTPALCGLGHGASGIGWALAEAAAATGEQRFMRAAEEAFLYERGWLSVERCAWPDLREPTPTSIDEGRWPGWMTAWCHGALGIGAARLRHYEMSRDLSALAEATVSIHAARAIAVNAAASLRRGHVSDVTLCHGLGGAAELMLLAYEVSGLPEHLRAARRVGDLCLEIYEANQRRWTCGLQRAERVPGLFLGLAGIGVTMLRLHAPSLIGSPMLAGRSAMTAPAGTSA